MSLYFGYNPLSSEEFDDTELKKDIAALKTGIATNNSKTKALEDSFFKKDGTVQMTGDLDMGDNSIIGVDDINANNSVVSKKYVDDNLGNKLSAPSNFVISKITFAGGISMGGAKIQHLDSPSSGQDATHKTYVDGKVSPLSTNISSLGTRVTALESLKRTYTYHFDFLTLDTSWSYPTSNAASVPYHWMYCKGLNSTSKFHVHTLSYDTDASLDNNFTFTFKLDLFDTSGNHTAKDVFTARRGDHLIPGERLLFIDKRFTFHGDSTVGSKYTTFVMARLAIKGSAVKGNEFTVSCSFEI